MKLHIGCGDKYLPGYKHLDVMQYEHIDYLTGADNLSMIEDEVVDEIYACHVLEHFGRHDNEKVLAEWNRVLKIGGTLRIAVPDFEQIVEEYKKNRNIESIMGLLYGGQTYEFNYHYQTFDFERIKKLLEANGFYDVKRYDWKEFLPNGFDDFSRAYIPHMNCVNGRLMSLNVVANK